MGKGAGELGVLVALVFFGRHSLFVLPLGAIAGYVL